MGKYQMSFIEPGPYGKAITKTFEAVNEKTALALAREFAEQENLREKGVEELSWMKVPEGPAAYSVEFNYQDTALRKTFRSYVSIYAADDKQAAQYYNDYIKGQHFWFNANKPDATGKCVYGKIENVVAIGGNCAAFDATKVYQTLDSKLESADEKTKHAKNNEQSLKQEEIR